MEYSMLSERTFRRVQEFRHTMVEELRELNMGIAFIHSGSESASLEYILGNLIDPEMGRVLPHDLPNSQDDIVHCILLELQPTNSRRAGIGFGLALTI